MPSQNDPPSKLTAPWGKPAPTGNELSRRSAIKLAMGVGGMAAAGTTSAAAQPAKDSRKASPNRQKLIVDGASPHSEQAGFGFGEGG